MNIQMEEVHMAQYVRIDHGASMLSWEESFSRYVHVSTNSAL